jgi:hypothetical protein
MVNAGYAGTEFGMGLLCQIRWPMKSLELQFNSDSLNS